MTNTPPDADDIVRKLHVLAHNERVKLTATWLNNLGVGSVVAGFIAQSISMGASGTAGPVAIVVAAAIWIPI